MKGGKRPLGYTIIEVMIVLAVSGVMFLIAASFIGGKQERTSFTAGVSEMASRIQDTIQQVTSGQYSDVGLNCVFTGSNTSVSSGINAQGTNSSCIFLGKIIHFSEHNSAGGSHNYETFSLAGRLVNPTVSTPVTLASTYPSAIDPSLTTQQIIPQQLDVSAMKITPLVGSPPVPGPPVTNYSLGFIQNLGASTGAGSFQSGGQTIVMVYGRLLATPGISESAAANSLSNSVDYAQQAQICVTDHTQTAELIIGTNNNQLSVDVNRNPGLACPPS